MAFAKFVQFYDMVAVAGRRTAAFSALASRKGDAVLR